MLQYVLMNCNTKYCGTVRTTRKNFPKNSPSDIDMRRGDIFTTSFSGVSYVKRMDNVRVHLLTIFLTPMEKDIVKPCKTGYAKKIGVNVIWP